MIWVVVGIFFILPLLSMVEFTLRSAKPGTYSGQRWLQLLQGQSAGLPAIGQGLSNSFVLTIVTVAIVLFILFPTMVLVELRFPRLRRVLEVVCLLPMMIPAIVMVVGLAPMYRMIGQVAGSGAWTLAFAYGITVLPYAYRAIQTSIASVDMVTLSEAGRTLGAGWMKVLLYALVPNLRRGLVSAAVLAVAVVLGEFTIASLLSRVNLQTALVQASGLDPFVAVIFALLALVFAFLLLIITDRALSTRRSRKATS